MSTAIILVGLLLLSYFGHNMTMVYTMVILLVLHYLLPAVEILRAGSLDGLGTYIDGVTKANDQIISVIKEL